MVFLKRIGLALLIVSCAVSGAEAAGISVGGEIQKPAQLSVTDLQALPPTTVTVSMLTEHGPQSGTYTGALLWTLVSNVQLTGEFKDRLHHTILVTGSDGYQVDVAIGEIDPNFEGKQVIIAYAKDGKPLDVEDGLRLIVPGDKHGGRAVRNVTHIDVK